MNKFFEIRMIIEEFCTNSTFQLKNNIWIDKMMYHREKKILELCGPYFRLYTIRNTIRASSCRPKSTWNHARKRPHLWISVCTWSRMAPRSLVALLGHRTSPKGAPYNPSKILKPLIPRVDQPLVPGLCLVL